MKYAIISDIHANLPALQTVLRDAEGQGCTHTACLGDIVGAYWQPKECLDIIRAMNIPCVKGDLDQCCSEDVPLTKFNPQAAEAIQWMRGQLSEGDHEWLRKLPLVQTVDGFTIVHAVLDQPDQWGYVFDKRMASASLERQTTPVCFFGHTHVPVAFIKDSTVRGGTYGAFRIEAGKQYFVNPGSVGQPRDNDPRAAYVIYDVDAQSVELRRLEYPRPEPPQGGPAVPRPGSPGPRSPLNAAREEPN